jgi:hypothetical protein
MKMAQEICGLNFLKEIGTRDLGRLRSNEEEEGRQGVVG